MKKYNVEKHKNAVDDACENNLAYINNTEDLFEHINDFLYIYLIFLI